MQRTWLPLEGMDALLQGAALIDARSQCVMAINAAALKLLGASHEALIGQPVEVLLHSPEDLAYWDEAAGLVNGVSDDALADDASDFGRLLLCTDTVVVGAGGEEFPVLRQIRPVRLADGRWAHLWSVVDRSDCKAAEAQLETLVAELSATLESSGNALLVVDLQGRIQSFNRAFDQLWQLPPEALEQRDDDRIYGYLQRQLKPSDALRRLWSDLADHPLLEQSRRFNLVDGRTIECHTVPQLRRGQAIGRVFSFQDISERLANDQRLTLAAKVFDSSLDAIFITDGTYRLLNVNPLCAKLMQRGLRDLIGVPLTDLLYVPGSAEGLGRILTDLPRVGRWEGELHHRSVDGSAIPLHVSLVPHVSHDAAEGAGFYCIGHALDLSEHQADKQRLSEMATRDALTGLPNRYALMMHLQELIDSHANTSLSRLAVFSVDLDRFKTINDTLGHAHADQVLAEVVRRIQVNLREGDFLARLGGDEFAVVLSRADTTLCERIGQQLLDALAQPFEHEDMHFFVTGSIGVAMYPEDAQIASALLMCADDAMRRVKENGRAALRFYQRKTNVDLLARMRLDHAMRTALSQRQYRLHYQPQVHVLSGAVVGVEALLRWTDPVHGPISPGRFIPVAEETGFIVALGEWVFSESVRQAAEWLQQGLEVPVSINVSAAQFQQKRFVEQVAFTLTTWGLPSGLVEIELTESILIGEGDEVYHRLRELANLGVRLAIDDFGTGYSNLAYLKRFPLSRLKIDRSFVDQLPDEESDVAITRAVIHMGHALNLRVIAEGVETTRQLDFLKAVGCDEYQGFLRSPAVPPQELVELLSNPKKNIA